MEDNDINDSIEKYKIYIHDILSNSLNNFKVSDGLIYSKLLLYKAIVNKEEDGLVKQVQEEPNLKNDSIVNQLLDKLSIAPVPKVPSKEEFNRLYKISIQLMKMTKKRESYFGIKKLKI